MRLGFHQIPEGKNILANVEKSINEILKRKKLIGLTLLAIAVLLYIKGYSIDKNVDLSPFIFVLMIIAIIILTLRLSGRKTT